MVSYADFITLLFAFFVVMFATSQTDKAKAQQVSDSVKKAIEGESFASMVKVIMGGTVDTTGVGNAQMKGPGGAKPTPKVADPKAQAQVVELLPSMNLLTKELEQEIKARKLTQAAAARELGIAQPRVNDLLRGRLVRFSIDALVEYLSRLGVLVRIKTSAPKRRGRRAA